MVGSGTTLGDRYLLHERIATGGMGDVWRAEDSVLGRTVAVKVLLPALLEDPGFIARFRAEARTMAALNHPGIVDVYDYGHSDGVAYLVMQYVQGEALSDLLDQLGPLAPGHTMRVVAQAGDALHAAHVHGIVHRDVKPANLLIRPDGRLALSDFGIALSPHAAALTDAGEMMGTASYLAPEQVSGGPVTPATDVYALGVVAYQCLAGHRPFEGDSPMTIAMMQINDEPPPLPTTLPAGVRMVVLRALAKDPAARWTSAAEMADAARAAEDTWGAGNRGAGNRGAGNPVAPAGAHESTLATIMGSRSPAPRRGRQLAVLSAMTAVLLAVAGLATYQLMQPGTLGGDRPSAAAPGETPVATEPPPLLPTEEPTPGPGDSLTATPSTSPPSVHPSTSATPSARPPGLPAQPTPTTAPPPPPPPPPTQTVPDVLGLDEANAVQKIADAGLTAAVTYEKATTKCTVLTESPVSGTHLPHKATVAIVVGRPQGRQCF
jgi:serine/threonine-protein kinase